MSAPERLPELIDVATLAKYLGVDIRHIRRLTHERRIPFIKWGHIVRFDPVDVADWLEHCCHDPRRPPADRDHYV